VSKQFSTSERDPDKHGEF